MSASDGSPGNPRGWTRPGHDPDTGGLETDTSGHAWTCLEVVLAPRGDHDGARREDFHFALHPDAKERTASRAAAPEERGELPIMFGSMYLSKVAMPLDKYRTFS